MTTKLNAKAGPVVHDLLRSGHVFTHKLRVNPDSNYQWWYTRKASIQEDKQDHVWSKAE